VKPAEGTQVLNNATQARLHAGLTRACRAGLGQPRARTSDALAPGALTAWAQSGVPRPSKHAQHHSAHRTEFEGGIVSQLLTRPLDSI